jgi:Na+/H+ antiporter NhaC
LSAQGDSTQIDSAQNKQALPSVPLLEVKDFVLSSEKVNGKVYLIVQDKTNDKPAYLANFSIDDEDVTLDFQNGLAKHPLDVDFNGSIIKVTTEYKGKNSTEKVNKLTHLSLRRDLSVRQKDIASWFSILPPLIAILLALIFKEVIISLFIGILSGSLIANGFRFDPYNLFMGTFDVLDKYIIGSLNDFSHLAVILFSMLIGGVVALISKNGGMAGVVNRLSKYATSARSSQMVTFALGIAIFFDDYANSLIVGNTMRPITDKYKVSREKLAYLVDSTAAPVAAIAFITTWIGAELSYIDEQIPNLSLRGMESFPSAYSIFISSLAYSFYPLLTIAFMFLIIYMKRDYGPMYKAEMRARQTGKVYEIKGKEVDEHALDEFSPVPGAPQRVYNALIPIIFVVGGTLVGLIETGMQNSYAALTEGGVKLSGYYWSEVWANLHQLGSEDSLNFFRRLGVLIGNADSYNALLWASLSASIVAIALTIGGRIMKLGDTMNTFVLGLKSMVPALMILVLAWSLATTTDELGTAQYLTGALSGSISPYFIPSIIFVIASAISFSTGSSWSTMAILYPIAIPLSWAICESAGLDLETSMHIFYNTVAVVLAASVLGDHCSPISDTTILSSLASNCNHMDHVRTQLPYALTVGAVSLALDLFSTLVFLPFIVNISLGIGILYLIIRFVGKPVPN